MAEPKRLLEQLGSGLERDLLIVGSTERAPSFARQRALASVLGVSALACAALPRPEAVVAGGSGASSTSALLATVTKWLAIGAFAGGTLSGAAAGFSGSQAVTGSAELRALPSISRQVASSISGMKPALERSDSRRAALERESKPQKRAARRASGTVWIGAPALSAGPR
jgi:hypothetical protein